MAMSSTWEVVPVASGAVLQSILGRWDPAVMLFPRRETLVVSANM